MTKTLYFIGMLLGLTACEYGSGVSGSGTSYATTPSSYTSDTSYDY